MRTADADLWGHLRYGRLFLENRSPILPDPFAYTSAGLVWHTHEYAAQILLWLAYAWGGPPGLIVLKCLVGGAGMALLLYSLRLGSTDARVWSPVAMLATSILGRYFLFRPQLFTYLGLAFFVWVLFRYLSDRRAPLWTLPFVLVFWVNLHGGFVAGIGAIGLAVSLRTVQSYVRRGLSFIPIWRDTRALWGILLACLVTSLLTPQGWRTWPFLVTELNNSYNRRFIIEWQPVNLLAPGWSGALALFLLLGMALVTLAAQRRGRMVWDVPPWLWGASTIPLAAMALISNRHIPILALWAAPVLVLLADEASREMARRRLRDELLLAAMAIAGLAAAFTITFVVVNPVPQISINASSLGPERPFGVAAFMRANGLRGNIYTPISWGSYLTWELYPNVLVSSDGRNDTLFTVAQVGENLIFYADHETDLDVPWRYASDFLLVSARTPALPRILMDGRWKPIYRDPDTVLFAKTGGPWSHLCAEQSQSPVVATFK